MPLCFALIHFYNEREKNRQRRDKTEAKRYRENETERRKIAECDEERDMSVF